MTIAAIITMITNDKSKYEVKEMRKEERRGVEKEWKKRREDEMR
jgi:hypothetical protein